MVAVQVTDFREFTMEVRILISARNAGRTFDLRCQMREQIVAFLQENYPQALPGCAPGTAPGTKHCCRQPREGHDAGSRNQSGDRHVTARTAFGETR